MHLGGPRVLVRFDTDASATHHISREQQSTYISSARGWVQVRICAAFCSSINTKVQHFTGVCDSAPIEPHFRDKRS